MYQFDPSLGIGVTDIPPIEIPTMPAQLQPPVITPDISEKFGEYAEQPTVYEQPVEVSMPSTGPIETLFDILGGVTGGAAEIAGGAAELAGGALETAGDVSKWVLDTLWNTGKFILENLEVGVKTGTQVAGTVGGIVATKEQQELEKQKLRLTEQALALQAQQLAAKQVPAIVPAEEGLLGQLIDVLFGKPAAYAVPEPEKAKPNILLYAGLAAAAYFLLRKR